MNNLLASPLIFLIQKKTDEVSQPAEQYTCVLTKCYTLHRSDKQTRIHRL